MHKAILRTAVFGAMLSFVGCAHTEEERRQRDFVSHADARVSEMEGNIAKLDKRVTEQLPGQPRTDLASAVENLKQKTDNAKAGLKELKDRNAATWVEKKPEVDRELYEMDGAYNEALRVFSAH